MSITPIFLTDVVNGGGAGQERVIAGKLLGFVASARVKLHLAVYDFRLSDVVGGDIVAALRDRATEGVDVKIAYDASKPDAAAGFLSAAADPAPVGTEQFLRTAFEGSKVKMKAIRGQKLMHNKYVIKDGNTSGAAVWTGSTNFTDDAWTLQENNIVIVESPELCVFYENDFNDLWSSGDIAGSGAGDYASVNVDGVRVEVNFSPANGPKIDQRIATIISGATRRIRVASMLISSRGVIAALDDAIAHAQVKSIDGLYDKTQMQQTLDSWIQNGRTDLVAAFNHVVGNFASKVSTPYSPNSKHNFMHNKIVVCDDQVFTGSFNLSRSATFNAENVLLIHDAPLADRYISYIDGLIATYRNQG